ncbi:STAS domain-containing protein [uncultured Endozoicomonas sp.]|uniref:STAS domain-containing protein n=1 Tax=uncultured Endozoicomonas sp. TaxID=432652 RepID=UPI00262EE25B|nr:STAS domain-containing protein [uncultured Endozoicomonas sp.]
MDYSTYQSNDCHVVELHDDFDSGTVNDIKGYFEGLIEDGAGDVLIDMSEMGEIDSSGVGALVFLYKRLRMNSRNLGLLGVNGQADELLTMLRISQAIKQYESIEEYLGKH